MRRIFLIVGILVALILIGVAIYVFFVRQNEPGLVGVAPGTQFGASEDGRENGGVAIDSEVPETGAVVAPRFVQVTQEPVAIGVLFTHTAETPSVSDEQATTTSELGTVPALRYIERASGNMYEYNSQSTRNTRITNQTVPGVVDSAWVQDGLRAFIRYLSDGAGEVVETYALAENEADGYFLETGLDQVLVTRDGTLVTLLPSSSGTIATVANADGTNARTLFSSNLTQLRIREAGDDFVVYTKASAGSGGYVFFVNGTSGTFTRLAGPLRGLTALPSPQGDTLLLSYRSGNAQVLELMDVATRTTIPLPTATLTEKCAWSLDNVQVYCAVPRTLSGTLPDEWYQGAVTFSDRIWRIDTDARIATLAVDPRALAEVELDMVSLTLDEAAEFISFINKTDGSLWVYDL